MTDNKKPSGDEWSDEESAEMFKHVYKLEDYVIGYINEHKLPVNILVGLGQSCTIAALEHIGGKHGSLTRARALCELNKAAVLSHLTEEGWT